jgi:hypothetical protein
MWTVSVDPQQTDAQDALLNGTDPIDGVPYMPTVNSQLTDKGVIFQTFFVRICSC